MKTSIMAIICTLCLCASPVFARATHQTKSAKSVATEQVVKQGEKININTANEATLMQLKGIGQKRADQIIAYRKAHGNFESIQDLTKIKGIGPKFIAKNQERMMVEE